MKFSIDKDATIRSILNALSVEGVNTSDVAKVIPNISEKPLRSALKEAGYEYSNKAPKGWKFVGEGEEPLEKSIFDYVKRNSRKVIKDSPTIHPVVTSSNTEITKDEEYFTPSSTVIHPQFTKDEVRMILEMLYEWQQNKRIEEKTELEENNHIHERIKKIPKSDKTRKTIVIDKSIGEILDEYCETEKVNKSDVLYIALMDFFRKYKK